MSKADNLKPRPPWKPGESGNPEGYPKGVPHRSTVARKVLEMNMNPPEKILKTLHDLYPALEKKLKVEEIITMIQGLKAMTEKDTQAYKALMDSAYGQPTQDITSKGSQIQGDIQINVRTPEQASELEQFIEYVRQLN